MRPAVNRLLIMNCWSRSRTRTDSSELLNRSGADSVHFRSLSVRNSTKTSAIAKSTARPSCLVGVLYDISQEKICWWLINHLYIIGTKATEFGEITQNNGHYAVQGHSRSPILVPIDSPYDFLLVINTNLPPIPFPSYGWLYHKFSLAKGTSLHFNAIAGDDSLRISLYVIYHYKLDFWATFYTQYVSVYLQPLLRNGP